MIDIACTSFSENQKRTAEESAIDSCCARFWWALSYDDTSTPFYWNSTITNRSFHYILSWCCLR